MQARLHLFKVGGRILEDTKARQSFLEGFAALPGPNLLVHGGGVFADELASRLQIPISMHQGRRQTSPEMRDLVTMVYGGLINKSLVAELQAFGCDALGLTGADARLFKAHKRKPEPIDFGLVGDIYSVRHKLIQNFLELGLCPVIAPLSLGEGEILNSNADGVARSLAIALSLSYQVSLLYCFDKPGVLLDASKPESLLPTLSPQGYQELKQNGSIQGGMLPKLESSFQALAEGVQSVLLASPEQSLCYALGQPYQGTLLQS